MSGTNFVFNVAKGRIAELHRRVDVGDPADSRLVWLLLEATGLETDAVLVDKDTVADLVSGATNEATFTGYTRQVVTAAQITLPTVDDTNDRVDIDAPDPSFTVSAPGNVIAKLVLAYDPDSTGGTDADLVPMVALSYDVTPEPTTITPILNGSGYARAS